MGRVPLHVVEMRVSDSRTFDVCSLNQALRHSHFDHVQGHAAMRRRPVRRSWRARVRTQQRSRLEPISRRWETKAGAREVDRQCSGRRHRHIGGTTLRAIWTPAIRRVAPHGQPRCRKRADPTRSFSRLWRSQCWVKLAGTRNFRCLLKTHCGPSAFQRRSTRYLPADAPESYVCRQARRGGSKQAKLRILCWIPAPTPS